MRISRASVDRSNGTQEPTERRRGPRIHYPMPVEVRGSRFNFATVVDDLGAGGICLRLPLEVAVGERLSFLVDFVMIGTRQASEPSRRKMTRISAHGIVMRVKDLQDGTFRLAAQFTHHIFV